MEIDPLQFDPASLPVPPSYQQCAALASGPRADCVISPLLVAALIDWLEEEDDD